MRRVSNLDFGILLGLAYQRFVDELNAHLDHAGFAVNKRTYGYVFRALADQPDMTTAQLAARLGITSQGAAKIVDDMVNTGYLRRAPDPADARARLLRLTDRGTAALAAARAFHQQYEADLIAHVGANAVADLRRALGALVGADDAALTRQLRPF